LGDDYHAKIRELVDDDQLPVELGGKCQCGAAGAQCPRVQLDALVQQRIAEIKEKQKAEAAPAAGKDDDAKAQ
jgi:hypothetical protein